jgi:hypothetical protein
MFFIELDNHLWAFLIRDFGEDNSLLIISPFDEKYQLVVKAIDADYLLWSPALIEAVLMRSQ